MKKIAIIGAGLSGLAAAHLLKESADITVFEKARGVSGRMSTRRADPYFFDHGAQYFTIRTQAFRDFLYPVIEKGLIERWNPLYVKFDGKKIVERKNWIDEEPRYVGVPGMNEVAKYLAQDINIHINTRISRLEYEHAWALIDDAGHRYPGFDWVISTIPAPQAIGLLPEDCHFRSSISSIEMQACIALMLGFEESLPLEFQAAHVTNSDLSWIAVNSHKPKRSEYHTLMVHSSAEYAEAHIDKDHEAVMQHLIAETSQIIGHDISDAQYKTVHFWRYANNTIREELPTLIDTGKHLAACGDWCVGGRVEGAFTSAFNLVNVMKKALHEF